MDYRKNMKITIEQIPHDKQRYNTVGDWQYSTNELGGLDLSIKVSEMKDFRYFLIVAVHELIESILCKWNGVKESQVDEWDISHPYDIEPGEIKESPYYREHLVASIVENVLGHELDINWPDYEDELVRVSK
jgi:hypothetical protein